jgi:hypothetical protein
MSATKKRAPKPTTKPASAKPASAKPASPKPRAKAASPKPTAKPPSPRRASRSLASPRTAQALDTSPPFLTQDPEAAYQHFLPEGQAIRPDSVKRLNVDADLVVNNVGLAVDAFQPLLAAVTNAVPAAPANRFLELSSLALALLYAADRVVGQASSGEIARRLAAVAELRAPMLQQLEIFASPAVGLADPQRVKAIRAGTGPIDKAHDAVNIVGYFNELGPAVTGKHPFTAAQLAELAANGQWLVQQLTPARAVGAPNRADAAAVIRDQLFTLLCSRYDALRAAVAVVVGLSSLDQYLPPLGTRVAAVRPKKAPAAAPAVMPAPAPAGKESGG